MSTRLGIIKSQTVSSTSVFSPNMDLFSFDHLQALFTSCDTHSFFYMPCQEMK